MELLTVKWCHFFSHTVCLYFKRNATLRPVHRKEEKIKDIRDTLAILSVEWERVLFIYLLINILGIIFNSINLETS